MFLTTSSTSLINQNKNNISTIVFKQKELKKDHVHKIMNMNDKNELHSIGNNVALLFAGLHYYEKYKHFSNENFTIDYREYIKCIQIKIYEYFKNYNIDTFIVTNNSIYLNDLLNTYKPVRFDTDEKNSILKGKLMKVTDDNHCIKKIKALQLLINYINETKKQYNFVILTRFDIHIMKEFTSDNLNLQKFNIVSVIDSNYLCDDNLFIFPINYLYQFLDIAIKHYNKNISTYSTCLFHYLKNHFEKNMDVNYIHDERFRIVVQLNFFKLRAFEEFILNKYIFTENVIYKRNMSDICIYESSDMNYIEFNGIGWFGYEINGKYSISFDIYSHQEIKETQNFINLYKTPIHVPMCIWTTIHITLETSVPEILKFIFTKKAHIKYKNVQLIQMN